jgi:esterase/lipase superfamily enzyme
MFSISHLNQPYIDGRRAMGRTFPRPARAVLLLPLVALLLGGCAPRADINPDRAAVDARELVPVYVDTTRARIPGALWSDAEPGRLNYARVDVSVPEEHELGLIELPGSRPDPRTDFLTRRVEPFADRAAFRATVARALAAAGPAGDEVVVTVHGFNNTMDEGVFRAAQMIRDFEIAGPTFHYAWPSRGAPLAYAADRDAVLLARDGLERMLDDIRDAGARGIVIVAHSMGAQVAM